MAASGKTSRKSAPSKPSAAPGRAARRSRQARVRVALLGCGRIADLHAEALTRAGAAVAACSRSPERAREAAARWGHGALALSPYDAAFDSPDIDAVAILTPHDSHVELALAALEHGKHVLLEKPAARTVAEAEPLARALAATPELRLMIAENFPYLPSMRHAIELVGSGQLGRLQSIVTQGYAQVIPGGWRSNRAMMGGGALIDGGVHIIHALRRIGGEITHVHAISPELKLLGMEGEEIVQLMARFANGATAALGYGWGMTGNPKLPEFVIIGEQGSLVVSIADRCNLRYRPDRRRPERTWIEPRRGPVDSADWYGISAVAQAFLACVTEGAAPAVTLADGLADVAVVEAAYRSLANGRPERVAEPPDWLA